MGAGNSNAATISISIDSDDGLVIPGKEISGKVYVRVLKETVGAQSLTLKVVGEETTLIDSSRDLYNQSSDTEVFFVKNMEFALTEAETGETCVIPFTFNLPYGLPPSMKFKSSQNKRDLCSVNYRVEVKMIKYQKKLLSSPTPLVTAKNSFPFYVPYQPVMTASNLLPAYIPEISLNCDDKLFNLGSCSTASIHQAELRVVETVSWNADGHSTNFTKTLSSKTVSKDELSEFQKCCPLYVNRGDNSPVFDGKKLQIQHEIIIISFIIIQKVITSSCEDDCRESSPVTVVTTSSLSPSPSFDDLVSWENEIPVAHPILK
jgi:hypothetical protein